MSQAATLGELLCCGLEVGYVNCPPLQHATANRRPVHHRCNEPDRSRKRAEMGDREQVIAFETEDRCVFSGTESCGAYYERVQHRLKIGGGAADRPQDLAGRRLLLQRLRLALCRRGFTLQSLRQALLKVADLGAVVLRRLAGERRPFGLRPSLRGPCPAPHQPLLGLTRRLIDDRLGEGRRGSKRGTASRGRLDGSRLTLVARKEAVNAVVGQVISDMLNVWGHSVEYVISVEEALVCPGS